MPVPKSIFRATKNQKMIFIQKEKMSIRKAEQYYKLKGWLALIAFIASLVLGFISLFIPPTGIIHSSVLVFVAQLLLFISGLIGINLTLPYGSTARRNREKIEEQ